MGVVGRCRAGGTKRTFVMEAARDEPNAYLRSKLGAPLATRPMRNEVRRSIRWKKAASADRDRSCIGAVDSPLRSMVDEVQR
jgi:hypothetical protein